MNTIRPLLLLVVLGGIGYAVYARLNSKPDNPPPGIADSWNEGLQVELPGQSGDGPAIDGIGANAPAPNWNTPPSASGDHASGSPPSWATGNNSPVGEASGQSSSSSLPPLRSDLQANAAIPRQSNPQASAGSPTLGGPNDTVTSGAPAFSQGNPNPPPNLTPPANDLGAMDNRQFEIIFQAIQQELEQDRLTEGLLQLTKLYDEPGLTSAQRQQIVPLMDQLAGTVIYSTRSLLLPPHEVKAGETLEAIAAELEVPAQLLAKINGIDDPNSLQPGERLKVLRGPFQALVDLQQREMTLRVGGMYAGRFPVGIGQTDPPQPGSYSVSEKVADPTYHGQDRSIDAGDPANPLGRRWLALGEHAGIHGSAVSNPAELERGALPGSIAMQAKDVEDAFDILSIGSKVTVRR